MSENADIGPRQEGFAAGDSPPPQTARELLEWAHDRYYGRVYGYCVRRLFAKDVAEDMVSAVFLRLVQRVDQFIGCDEARIRNWLFGAASNAVSAHVRTTKVRQKVLDAVRRQRANDLDRQRSEPERLDWPVLYEAIFRLKPRHQDIVTLRFLEGFDHEEIAEILGMRPVTVRVTMMRALRKLRKLLQGSFGERSCDRRNVP